MKPRPSWILAAGLLAATCTEVNIEPVPVAEVSVIPAQATLRVSEEVGFTTELRGPGGDVLTGRGVRWASTDESVAVVDTLGRTTATGPGQALLTAASEGVVGTALLVVELDPLETRVPRPPAGLSANESGATGMDLEWEDRSDNERWFEIQRRRPGSAWSMIATPDANRTTYADSGLSPETEYEYRIRACNTLGCSRYSNRDKDKTDDD